MKIVSVYTNSIGLCFNFLTRNEHNRPIPYLNPIPQLWLRNILYPPDLDYFRQEKILIRIAIYPVIIFSYFVCKAEEYRYQHPTNILGEHNERTEIRRA